MTRVHNLLHPSSHHATWVKTLIEGHTKMAPWTLISNEHPEHTETIVDWALKEGIERLVVWGGDGTFHRVVRILHERKALERLELALVPVGTCNDLARKLNLSKYFWRRWEAPAPQGRLANLALWRMTSTDESGKKVEDLFVNNAGFGRPRDSFERKDRAWGVLKSFQTVPVTVRYDGNELRGIYYMALACNAPYFSGGLHFEKDVSPEKGELNVYFVPARSKTRLGFQLFFGRLGLPLFSGVTKLTTTTRISLDTKIPVWPQADGEPPRFEGVRQMIFEKLAECARLWVPE